MEKPQAGAAPRRRLGCLVFAVVVALALTTAALLPLVSPDRAALLGPLLVVTGWGGLIALLRTASAALRRAADACPFCRGGKGSDGRHTCQRSALLSIASHELKGPLTTIVLNSQSLMRSCARLVETGDLASVDLRQCARQAAAIERQSARMSRLAGNLLDLERLEAERLDVVPRPTDLLSLAREAAAQAQTMTASHRVRVECELGRVSLPIDPDRIEQVLENLLGNALKYSPAGRDVELRIEERGSDVVCAVKDQGIGIPVEDQPRLFGRFFRASNARDAGIVGFGLGLYICREIVERHGGRMWVESDPEQGQGQGSTFYFALPHHRRPEAQRVCPPAPVPA